MTVKERITKIVNNYDSIIVIGTGRYFRELENLFGELDISSDKVIACMDNNKDKQGMKIGFCESEYVIQPVDTADFYNDKNALIIVAILKSYEIRNQLNQLNIGLDVIDYSFLKHVIREEGALKKWMPDRIRLKTEPTIPKVIHYCWFGDGKIPDQQKKYIEGWRRLCPDYEIKLWNEKNYDVTKNLYMKEAYETKHWGFVPDYARLDIIYKYGGIYLDTDVELVKSFDDLLYQDGFAGFEPGGKVAFGLGFGAVAGLPIIQRLRDGYKNREFVKKDGSYNLTPSPVYQTDELVKFGLQQNGEYQIVENLTIFPEKTFCPQPGMNHEIKSVSYTFSIHHYEGSWLDEGKKTENDFWMTEYKRFMKNYMEEE